jgi:hypothetical protein
MTPAGSTIKLVGGRAIIGDAVQPNRPKAQSAESGVVIPDGEYSARLVSMAPFRNAHGDRVGFSFEITDGPHVGVVQMQSAARNPSPTGKLAALLLDLLGRAPTRVELRYGIGTAHIGLTCRIIVREGRSRSGTRYSRVERVIRT